MTYSESDSINPYEIIYNIYKDPNEYFPFNGLLIKNDKNIESLFSNHFQIESIINPKISVGKDVFEEKNNLLMPKLENFTDKKEKKDNSIPSIYYFEDFQQSQNKDLERKKVIDIFNEINFFERIEEIKKSITFLENKISSSDYENKLDFNSKELIEKTTKNKDEKMIHKKRGRSSTNHNHNNSKIHDKMKPDNIIKKIKGKIFEYAIRFLNNILNKENDEQKILNLDYRYINILNIQENLKYLNMTLKELFSKDISPKYLTKEKDFNKNFIEKVLLDKKMNETIKFAFKITLRDWIDLFTLKKSVEELLKKTDKNIDCKKIKRSIYSVGSFINEIREKNGKEYLTPFIFLLYNYERWFSIKSGRKKNKK